MAELLSYICVIAVFFINVVNSDIFIGDLNPPKNTIDSCTSECIKRLRASNIIGASDSCSRGCRFFAIAQLIDGCQIFDQETAKETCKSSCIDSYGENNVRSESCVTGCMIPTPKMVQSPLMSDISWSVFEESGETLQIYQGGIPYEPDDALTDPSLMNQVARVKTIRIPEMRVRTLPVSQFKEEGMVGWWGGCGRGLPHCLAASLLLLLILVALWFGLSLEEPPKQADNCLGNAPPLPQKTPIT